MDGWLFPHCGGKPALSASLGTAEALGDGWEWEYLDGERSLGGHSSLYPFHPVLDWWPGLALPLKQITGLCGDRA